MIRTVLGQRFDRAASLGALGESRGVVTANEDVLQRITTDSLAAVLVVLVVIGLGRRRPLLGIGAAFAAGVAVVVTDVLKVHVLTQPNLIGMGSINTFPSGHTASAVACAMALVLVSPPRFRGAAAVVAGGYGWVTAAQVQTAGWHKPSDAIGAAFLALAAVTAVAGLLARYRPVERPRVGPTPAGRWQRWPPAILRVVAVIAGLGTAGGLVDALTYVARHPEVDQSPAIWHAAYLTGLALTVGIVVLLLMVLLALLGGFELDGRAAQA
jgi:membrane-associated phospholipid phosphatase